MRLTAILAMDRRGVIGKDNALPWRLSSDLKRFKTLTYGKPLIMGRKTHESIGRPLPERRNIVISRTPGFQAAGCEVVPTLDEALELISEEQEVMILGGAQLLSSALSRCTRFLLSWVDAQVEGDTTFPPPDWREWQPVRQEFQPADENNEFPHWFFDLRRVKGNESAPAPESTPRAADSSESQISEAPSETQGFRTRSESTSDTSDSSGPSGPSGISGISGISGTSSYPPSEPRCQPASEIRDWRPDWARDKTA